MTAIQKHFRTCNLCEAMCGIVIEHEGEKVVSIKGDDDDSFSRGHICPKAVALADIHNDPDRLRTPIRRTSTGWEAISWDEAFDEVATRLQAIQAQHGRHSVAFYQGNPTVHNHGSMIFGQLFSRALRSKNRFSATSVDQLPHMLAAFLMFGHQLMLPIPDIDRTDFFLVLGANPMISNGSLMSAPDMKNRLKAIQARGGKIVVIDPRRTETAELADQHHFLRPGTDAFLLAAMVYTFFEEKLVRLGHLQTFVDGVQSLEKAVAPFSPESCESITGLSAATIRQLARDFAGAKRAVCYGRIGVCTQEFGGVGAWLINAINILTANLDREGGAMFTNPALDIVGSADRIGMRGSFGRYKSRVRGLPEFGGELPVVALAEDILQPGAGQIRALVTSAGNPVLSTPNGAKLDEALQSLDFMVAIDIYLNETTRHAHIILPPTFSLEHDNYDAAFHVLAIRNTAKYSPALFERSPETRHDWEIFSALAARLGPVDNIVSSWIRRAKILVGERVTPTHIVDLGIRLGPYGSGLNPFASKSGLSIKKLIKNPHGIDLGPMRPVLPKRLNTRDKRVQLLPEIFCKDLERLDQRRRLPPSDELLLIGRREMRTNNSWLHNSQRMIKGKPRCTLLMHPHDASQRNLVDGQTVQVNSRVGRIDVPLQISDEVLQGVVSLPHGWGHDRAGSRLRVASGLPGVSINDITDETRIDALSGVAAFSGTPVTVKTLPETTMAAE
jgi:anaerobic selenocysteine-containing dehydrogenase